MKGGRGKQKQIAIPIAVAVLALALAQGAQAQTNFANFEQPAYPAASTNPNLNGTNNWTVYRGGLTMLGLARRKTRSEASGK